MDLTIRACTEDEFADFLRATEAAFGGSARDDEVERIHRLHGIDRTVAALEDDVIVGGGGAYSFSLSVPGGEVPAAGVTLIGVLPTHRRRGILRRMMRHQLDDIHARGEPLAILWASEGGIYHRYGYGLASMQAWIDVERERASFREPSEPQGTNRLVSLEEAAKVLPEVYDRLRAETPGMFARSAEWWQLRRLSDHEADRHGMGPKFCNVWENEGRAEGYVIYRSKLGWDEGNPTGELEVVESVAVTPLAIREIWRFVFGIDLIQRIKAFGLPADLPLPLLVAEPRRLRWRLTDALWLRIVDVAAALEGRTYGTAGSLVIEVRDGFCPWNEGVWRLETGPSGTTVERTRDAPDVALDATALGGLYLGGFSFTSMVRALRAEELSPGAAERADALFASARTPWCPEIF